MASMRFLLDFFPIALFAATYKLHGIYTATGVLMIATVIQSAIIYAIDRRLQPMQKATLVLVLLFGALTLGLHDERFIKWKPTFLYLSMSVALAVALRGWNKNLLRMLLGTHLKLPDLVWHRLNIAWIIYFVFMAASNAYVAALYSTDTWVNFKLWGYVFPLVFIIGQGFYISRYLKDDQQP